MDTVDASERMKNEWDDATKRYHQVLLSIRHIVKTRYDGKDKSVDTLSKPRLLY